jgi:hypothetical protein
LRGSIAAADHCGPGCANITVLSPEGARRRFETIAGDNQGLPLVAIMDGYGRLCSILRQPATVSALQGLRAAYSR